MRSEIDEALEAIQRHIRRLAEHDIEKARLHNLLRKLGVLVKSGDKEELLKVVEGIVGDNMPGDAEIE